MEFIIGAFVGLFMSLLIIIISIKNNNKPVGTLIIDLSNPTNDKICEFIMDVGLNEIYKRKKITLNVKTYLDESPIAKLTRSFMK